MYENKTQVKTVLHWELDIYLDIWFAVILF